MEIRIITTGGTIDGLDYDKAANRPKASTTLVDKYFESAKVQFRYVVDQAFSKDSRFITLEDLEILKKKILASTENRILITHGTLTIIRTAEFLGKAKLDKTIVLVGSFVLGTDSDTDAPFNLGYSIHALQTLNSGVYVAMNGQTFRWDNILKNEAENRFEKK